MVQIRWLIDLFSKLGLLTSGFAILFMILLISVEVIGRRVLNFSTLIADEYSAYLLVVITFMGSAYTFKSGGFTRMEVIYSRFKRGGRLVIDLLINLIALLFLLVIDYWVWIHIISSYRSGTRSISIFQTPLFIPQSFMGIGITFLLLEALLKTIMLFVKNEREGI